MIQNELARAALEVTRQWAIDELEAARARVTNLRYGGEAYNDALNSIFYLTDLLGRISYSLGEESPIESLPTSCPDQVDPGPDPEPERPIPSLEEVRGKCGEARKKGVDIKGILEGLGYKNLSAVDPKDYNKLLDMVEEALGAIG